MAWRCRFLVHPTHWLISTQNVTIESDHQYTHLFLAEHALPDAGKRETHLCRVLPSFCFYNTALHLRKGFMVRECRFRAVFSLGLFVVWFSDHDKHANPLGTAG